MSVCVCVCVRMMCLLTTHHALTHLLNSILGASLWDNETLIINDLFIGLNYTHSHVYVTVGDIKLTDNHFLKTFSEAGAHLNRWFTTNVLIRRQTLPWSF